MEEEGEGIRSASLPPSSFISTHLLHFDFLRSLIHSLLSLSSSLLESNYLSSQSLPLRLIYFFLLLLLVDPRDTEGRATRIISSNSPNLRSVPSPLPLPLPSRFLFSGRSGKVRVNIVRREERTCAVYK